ncbi:hypothetical protein D1007_03392 [Hordeum vulgare]|nr:hypothetical protein D1007_03392 [Hordeum vulgare]
MAAASDEFSSTDLDSQGKDKDLGDFFDKLDLHEEEFDDVVVEEEAPELLEDVRWVALARVHTSKIFSQSAFYKDMRAAWNCSQQVRFRPIGPNLFVVQVYCLGDWDRVMQHGPWVFRNMVGILAPYDGFTKAKEVPIVFMPIWLQIHKLPDGYCRHALIVKLLRNAGDVLETRINGNSGGHDHKECGIGVFEEKDLKYGAYLYADHPPRGRPEREAQSGNTANINPSAKPVTSKDVSGAKGESKASSPSKNTQQTDMDLDKSSRKRLNGSDGDVTPRGVGSPSPKGKVLLITDDQGADDQVEPCDTVGSKRAKDLIRSRITMVLRQSWHLKNEIIHGKTIPPLDISCSFLSSYSNSYNDVAMSVEEILKGKTPITASAHAMIIPSKPPCTPWPVPAVQEVALSVDGSFDPVDGSAGAGMILREDRGAVLFASYRKLFNCNEAL